MLPQGNDEKNVRWIYRCARCAASVGVIEAPERLPSIAGPLGADGIERVLLCINCYEEFKSRVLWPWVIDGVPPAGTVVTEEAS